MNLHIPLPVMVRAKRARLWQVLVGSVSLLGVVLGSLFLATPAAQAKYRGACDQGTNVGQVCHFLQIVSEGPRYDIDGWIQRPSGQKIHTWHEENYDHTTWKYYYSQFGNPPKDTMNFRLDLRGNSNIGKTDSYPITEDRCYLIKKDRTIIQRDCPTNN